MKPLIRRPRSIPGTGCCRCGSPAAGCRTGSACARCWSTVALAVDRVRHRVVSLATGDFVVPIPEVLTAIFGEAAPRSELVVMNWRMPRVLLALMLGAALGVAGAIFQSLTRNPLGSPDIIGLDTGAYTGALIVIIAGTPGRPGRGRGVGRAAWRPPSSSTCWPTGEDSRDSG